MINVLGDPEKLKIQVETLGFQHLDLEVTAPRVIVFRDAIVDLLATELGAECPHGRVLLSAASWDVGGAYIYIKETYAGRIRSIATGWAAANNQKLEEDGIPVVEGEGGDDAGNMDEQADKLMNMYRQSDEAGDNAHCSAGETVYDAAEFGEFLGLG